MPSMGILIINTLGPKSAPQRLLKHWLRYFPAHAPDFCSMGFSERKIAEADFHHFSYIYNVYKYSKI
jgi:hypothetical protein